MQTVEGREIWQGPAVLDVAGGTEAVRVEVPVSVLDANDYFIELLEVVPERPAASRSRYFLRVRR